MRYGDIGFLIPIFTSVLAVKPLPILPNLTTPKSLGELERYKENTLS